nr:tRNA (adenosine(37)-N6)-threonylcarbamoyltransferase complex ATPase subunit type 1 TsaE [uncultured Solibaculum sp.]
MVFVSHSSAQTEKIGRQLATQLGPGSVVALYGGLGMGKTAFVRGLASGLGVDAKEVSSPTFALVHEHEGRFPLFHFDMYRVSGWDDLESTGFFDYLQRGGIMALEWSENVEEALPENAVHVTIAPGEGPEDRIITIIPDQSEKGGEENENFSH